MYNIPRVKLQIETSREYGRGLLRGIARYSKLHGPWSFYREPFLYRKSKNKHLLLDEWLVDGIIADTDTVNEIRVAIENGIPAIVQGITDVFSGLPTIVSDDCTIGKMGAEHLLDKGFENFAYYGIENMYWSCRRCEGFKERLSQSGYDVCVYKEPKNEYLDDREDFEIASICGWLKELPKPIGLMACNDDRSMEVIQACLMLGLCVPDDVAVIGVDDDTIVCDLSNFPLSSIALSNEKSGYLAAAMLDRMMKGEKVGPEKIVSEPMYVVTRQSTDILTIKDREVANGLKFIRNHINDQITVEDVANEIALSRRMAEIRFRKSLGVTINSEIQKQRIKQVSDLLLTSELPIAKIAEQTGFRTATYMSEVFRKFKNMTPLAYRRKHRNF